MSYSHTMRGVPKGASIEEVMRIFSDNRLKHGNDLDLLTQAMMLLEAGHYEESIQFSARVMQTEPTARENVAPADLLAAQRAFLAGVERAEPLYAQAASEMGSEEAAERTMQDYRTILEMLKGNPEW